MQYTSPQEYFFTLVRISMVAGFAVAFPVIGYQLWRFIAPGLYKSEKNAFLPFLVASPALFLIGAAFSHYVVTPIAMDFFLGFADASSIVAAIIPALTDLPTDVPADASPDSGIDIVFQGKVNETLDISLKLIIAFGMCFQLPVLLTLMGKAGIVSSAGLAGMRKYAVVLILFFAVYPLYEVSILLIRRIEKRREAELRAEGLWDEDEPADETEGKV
jgi:sec-independent protein translocase protein TatC